jgi:hypothetical protein
LVDLVAEAPNGRCLETQSGLSDVPGQNLETVARAEGKSRQVGDRGPSRLSETRLDQEHEALIPLRQLGDQSPSQKPREPGNERRAHATSWSDRSSSQSIGRAGDLLDPGAAMKE